MEIRALNIDDDLELTAAYLVECVANQNSRPDWKPLSKEARMLSWRASDGWRNHLVGAWDDSKLLGVAAGMNHADTPETTWVFSWVEPDEQRSGIGSALVRTVESTSQSSTTRFTTSIFRPETAQIDQVARDFLQPLGYAPATTETVVELDLSVVSLPEPRTIEGYEINTYVNGVPERYREQVGRIKGLVDSEAPNGDLDWNESPVSPEEYADEISLWKAQEFTVLETIAITPEGAVAAWTCLLVPVHPAIPAQVEGTLVVSAHRGHALGFAVKLDNLRCALAETEVKKVRTSSDDENVWMRSINSALGFEPVETEMILQKKTCK